MLQLTPQMPRKRGVWRPELTHVRLTDRYHSPQDEDASTGIFITIKQKELMSN
jgi:hypothetical protein